MVVKIYAWLVRSVCNMNAMSMTVITTGTAVPLRVRPGDVPVTPAAA